MKLWAVREQTLAEWRRFNEIYEIPDPFRRQHRPKGPRWGQPGRGRRRKARFAARKRERQMQEIRAMMNGPCLILPQGSVTFAEPDPCQGGGGRWGGPLWALVEFAWVAAVLLASRFLVRWMLPELVPLSAQLVLTAVVLVGLLWVAAKLWQLLSR